MTIYIAGPMTGIPDYNRPAFHEAEKLLNDLGHVVINPARLPTGLDKNSYMPICTAMIDAVEAVCFLPGWMGSEGASLEYLYARHQGKTIYKGSGLLDLFEGGAVS